MSSIALYLTGVVVRTGVKPMTLVNVSRLAKNALDSEGQDVALKFAPGLDHPADQGERLGLCRTGQRHGSVNQSAEGIFAAALWKELLKLMIRKAQILWLQQEGS